MSKTYAHQLNITPAVTNKKSSLAIKKAGKTPKVSAEFMKKLDRVIAEHEDVLRELAKR